MSSLTRNFSHIYVEKSVADLSRTRQVLERFPRAEVVSIDDYKEVFNRPRQNWKLQKQTRKLILARKKDGLAYECGDIAPDFGFKHFYYNALMLNCIYDCSYCYLQGMYPSANIVVFTNLDEYFEETDRLLTTCKPLYLCISYDTDLLALNDILPYADEWIAYASSRQDLLIELRTKSVAVKPILKHAPSDNVVLAWTLSPATITRKYESLTPPFEKRLEAIKRVVDAGWKVRLCFDPILNVEGWSETYREMIDTTFSELPAESIRDVSIGTFRMNAKYLKRVKRIQPDSDILYTDFKTAKGVCAYPQETVRQLTTQLKNHVRDYLPTQNIVITG